MQSYPVRVSRPVAALTTASQLITDGQTQRANALIDDLLTTLDPQDDITKLCALALRHRNETEVPMYRRHLAEDDKQINVFDLVLRCVPPVRVVSQSALHVMKELYSSGLSSVTHLNIGIGKGRFEMKLLEELSQIEVSKIPKHIKIIGIDIDHDSLRETGEAIQHLANTLFPVTTTIEYTPIFAFAEAITPETWRAIQNHGTDVLGVISAFTLHHLPTQAQRQEVINEIAKCNATLFMLLEPDVDHFTPDLAQRVENCWNIFGKIFKQIDCCGLSDAEAKAIKFKFFGREIEDILGNEEDQRSEKHEPAQRWADRLAKANFSMHRLISSEGMEELLGDAQLDVAHNLRHKYVSTRYEDVPMVAMFAASTFW